MDLFPFSGEEKESSTLLGPLQRANLNHPLFRIPNGGQSRVKRLLREHVTYSSA
jgi:hypothetical protein